MAVQLSVNAAKTDGFIWFGTLLQVADGELPIIASHGSVCHAYYFFDLFIYI